MKTKTEKIALLNAKGGTAKTCSTQNLSHALAMKGKKVLAVDFDPQQSLTLSFGLNPLDCEMSISDVLLDGHDINKAIIKTSVEGVDLVPGSLALSKFDIAMSSEQDGDERLKKALANVKGYDYIVVDPAPTASLLMVNVLLGVDRFIIPTTPAYLSFEGLSMMLKAVEDVKESYGYCANLLGILLTQVDYRNKATHELVKLIRNHYSKQVFNSEIKVNVRLSEAPSHGKTVMQHDPASHGAFAYLSLADEVLKRINNKKGKK